MTEPSRTEYTPGHLAAVQYKGGYAPAYNGDPNYCTTTFTEMYSYSQAGGLLKKRLQITRPLNQYTNVTANLDAAYTYDTEGRVTATQYPSTWNGSSWVAGPNLSNTYDSMGRLLKLTDVPSQTDIISNTTYSPAGQLLTTTGQNGAPSETRTYNSIGQLTQLTICPNSGGYCPTSLNIQYNYSATQNNGKIASETDVLSGEQITYTYDSLNRLASATSSVNPGWGQSYAYDGFGNLTTQTVTKGTAPSLSVSYDPTTNRQTGESADANGNICSGWWSYSYSCPNAYTYDAENRIVFIGGSATTPPTAAYSYAPGNKRVWRGNWSGSTQTVDEVTFWGANGQKLTTYGLSIYASTQLVASSTGSNYYFGDKLIKNTGGYVTPDRLGSIGKYVPYGQERPSATTDGKEKFATYFRDAETGLDYADQRYHQPGMGRFMTPDPSRRSVNPRDPGSWNKYAYVGGDPVNSNDPNGLYAVPVAPGDEAGYCWENPQDPDCWPFGGNGPATGPDANSNAIDPWVYSVLLQIQGLANDGLVTWYTEYPDGGPGTIDDVFSMGLAPNPDTIGQIAGICASMPVTCTVGNGVLAIMATAAVIPKLIDSLKQVRGHSDPITLNPRQGTRDKNGDCVTTDRPPQYKWQAINQQGMQAGVLHWHWIQWNLNPDDCVWFPKRQEGPDPGPDYILIPGVY